MGRKDENYHAQVKVEAWEHLIGYTVEDATGARIGTLKALWEDFTRRPAYLGIATSWLDFGRIHVVPAQYASISERTKRIRLPFSAATVKHAPECHGKAEITLRGETKIRDYYRGKAVEGALETLDKGPQSVRPQPLARPMRQEIEPPHDWRPRPDPEAFEVTHEDTFVDEHDARTGYDSGQGLRRVDRDDLEAKRETESDLGLPGRHPQEEQEPFIPLRDLDSDAERRRRFGDADRDQPLR